MKSKRGRLGRFGENLLYRSSTAPLALLLLLIGACSSGNTADVADTGPTATADMTAETVSEGTTTPDSRETAPTIADGAFASIPESLVQAAQEESGDMIWYSSDGDEAAEIVLSAFQEEYPFTSPRYAFHNAGDVASRIQQEYEANARTADVASSSVAIVKSLSGSGMVAPTDWVSLGMPATLVADEYMSDTMSNVYVLVYNTDLVEPADAPEEWQDLLDPRWRGQIALTTVPGHFASLVAAWGPEETQEYFTELLQQEPALGSNESIAQAVAAGEYLVGTSTLNSSGPTVAAGAPIAVVIPDPASMTQIYSFIPEAASNPNTGRLFVMWMNTEAGSQVVDDATRRGNTLLPGNNTSEVVEGRELAYFKPEDSDEFGRWLEDFGAQLREAVGE